jgi:acyl-CoA reductase-like NAD-dependent aldehyde dehydrogenase
LQRKPEAGLVSDDSARIMNEGPLGPIIVTHRFAAIEAAIRPAHRLPFGFASYGFTRSALNQARLADGVAADIAGINFATLAGPSAPFADVQEIGEARSAVPRASRPIWSRAIWRRAEHIVPVRLRGHSRGSGRE